MQLEFKNSKKISFSNLLIIISAIFTLFSFIYPNILVLGMNNYFLNNGNYTAFLVQIFTYSFLHGSIFHLLSNSIFLYIFGNPIEEIIGKRKFIIFFVLATIFNAGALTIFSSGNTIGISGFAMAILTYYTLILKSKNNPEYKGGLVAIILNILIGFDASISFIGHRAGAIFGYIFYNFTKK
ncbi:MAG: rhomboid family intramembrane serine protease [Candidatus Gracilibacteria bacterium]|nr:rhomboid family intramembrane serine protease [Candidatus Gracilibacteria bacterium]